MNLFNLYFYLTFAVSNGKRHFSKIMGGHTTDISSVPYQVSLQFNYHHVCGGSIIGPSTILTAAHCVQRGHASNYSIRAGSSYCIWGGKLRQVSEIICHPLYNTSNGDYDIAILYLEKSLQWTDTVQLVELAHKAPKGGEQVWISGWGALHEKSQSQALLQSVIIPILSNQSCHAKFRGVTKAMFCAGYLRGGKDSCKGDSGGPAVLLSNGKQIGIVSWGKGCGRINIPGVYTNIPYLKSWIQGLIR